MGIPKTVPLSPGRIVNLYLLNGDVYPNILIDAVYAHPVSDILVCVTETGKWYQFHKNEVMYALEEPYEWV